MKTTNALVGFTVSYEQIHDGNLSTLGLQPKKDARGIYTIGYGHALIVNGRFVTDETPNLKQILEDNFLKDESEARKLLAKDIKHFENGVNKRLKVIVSQNQFDALVSHAFNCGYSSTLYNLVNTNASCNDLKNWFTTKYITAGGIPLRGLQFRRNDEWQMYSCGDYKRNYNLSI